MMYEQIAANKRKTWLVVGFYLILFLLVGIGLGYTVMDNAVAGMVIALVAGGLYTMMMISQSTDVVMRLNHATEVTEYEQAPQLWHIVEDMAMIAKVPRPRIFVIDDDSPNAFATGSSPEKAAVAVTTGLLQRLNREELEGVLAHEFAHIRNYDVRLQIIAILVQFGSRMMFWGRSSRRSKDDENGIAVILMVISILAMILGPFMSTILQLAISRNREYLADATAVEFTRNPQGLISALEKISKAPAMEEADPQSAALYIANPFKKGNEEKDSWFATHPATSNRIKRLREM